VGAVSFQPAPVDNHARGPAFLAEGERRNDDVGQAAIFFQRAGMPHERHGLAFDHANAAEQIAAEGACVGGRGGIALIAVGQQPIVDAVACRRRRGKDQVAGARPQGRRAAVALDQHIGALDLWRESETARRDHQTKRPSARLPQAKPQATEDHEYERGARNLRQNRDRARERCHPLSSAHHEFDAKSHGLERPGFESERHGQHAQQCHRHDQ
jgi:hypothetical protein